MSSRPRWPGRTQKFNRRHVQRRNQDELRQELHTTKMIHMIWEETWIGSSFAGFSQQEHLPAFQKLLLHRRQKKEHGSWLLLLLARSGGDWSLGWCEYKGSTLGDIWVDLCWDSSTGFFSTRPSGTCLQQRGLQKFAYPCSIVSFRLDTELFALAKTAMLFMSHLFFGF